MKEVYNWSVADFSSIRLYRMNWDEPEPGGMHRVIDSEGKFNPRNKPKDGVLLNSEDVDILHKILYYTGENKGDELLCFMPHHAIVFMSSNGDAVAQLDICFMCRTYFSLPNQLEGYLDFTSLRNLFLKYDIPLWNPEWYPDDTEQSSPPKKKWWNLFGLLASTSNSIKRFKMNRREIKKLELAGDWLNEHMPQYSSNDQVIKSFVVLHELLDVDVQISEFKPEMNLYSDLAMDETIQKEVRLALSEDMLCELPVDYFSSVLTLSNFLRMIDTGNLIKPID